MACDSCSGSGSVVVAGVAWDQHTGIAKVEVRIDGEAWRPAQLGPQVTDDYWRQWYYEWDAEPGQHFIDSYLNENEWLPGFRSGMANVSLDEQRHIGFGVKMLAAVVIFGAATAVFGLSRSMALSLAITKAGHSATSIETDAVVHLEKVGEAMTITGIDLTTRGTVPGIDAAEFERLAQETAKGCIVSRALAAVPMTVAATLEEDHDH